MSSHDRAPDWNGTAAQNDEAEPVRRGEVAGAGSRPRWPAKLDLFGVGISPVDYQTALECVIERARLRLPAAVTHLAVHGLMEGTRNPSYRQTLDGIDIVAPDGQPVRLALNWLHHTRLPDRCYGPEFMLRVCRRAALEGVTVYLYGSHPHVVSALSNRLRQSIPSLNVAGAEPSAFRTLSPEEDEALVERINGSGAGIVFVGLGCPLQERFAVAHRDRIAAVQICVGAAFDFHAGNKKMAPAWMQRCSLEWLYRLLHEPRRLMRRYAVTNTLFVMRMVQQYSGLAGTASRWRAGGSGRRA